MKPLLCVTTSGGYEHILPIFIHLYQKFWNDPDQRVQIVGYNKPNFAMPDNFSFHSMGEQNKKIGAKSFGTDLRKFFEGMDRLFIWCMEDSFTRAIVYPTEIRLAVELMQKDHSIGRFHLGPNSLNIYSEYYNEKRYGKKILQTPPAHDYSLSTQIAIWNRDYLLKYLQSNMSPWEFECQDKINDGFKNIAYYRPLVNHNEGCRKHDLYKYNFEGIDEEVIQEMKTKKII